MSPSGSFGLIDLYTSPPLDGTTGPSSVDIDIVAVHGLDGKSFDAWTSGSTLWLRDLLPSVLPCRVRIMTFSYNANLWKDTVKGRISTFADQLLFCLQAQRGAPEEIHRPLMFIAHSMGGIIIKKALITANTQGDSSSLLSSTKSIVFFGTPHRGSAHAAYGHTFSKVLSAVRMSSHSDAGKEISSFGPFLKDVNTGFATLAQHISLLTIWELRPMRPGGVVVEEYSAKMDVPNERQCGINRDHVTLCKFDGESDPEWRMIYPHIRDLVSVASGFRATKHRTTDKVIRFNIPSFADQAFFDRGDILEEMLEHLAPRSGKNQSYGLFGLGGVGKTQLAMKFVDKHADQYAYIFWMHGESKAKLTPQYDQVAIKLGLMAFSDGRDDSKVLFHDWLTSDLDKPCLLIFDNADDVEVLRWSWPPHSPMLSILLTSRDQSTKHQRLVAAGREVTPLSHEEGASFFLTYIDAAAGDSELESALAISKMLGGHPLALRHAAGYVEDMACSLTDFISDFETSQAVHDYEATAALVGYDKALTTLFDMSFRGLSEDSQLILDILSLMDPDDIADSVIFQGGGDLDHFPDVLCVRRKYNLAIGALQKTSLLKKDRALAKISIHRLVQDTVRRRWDSSRSQMVFQIVSRCLVSIFPRQDQGQSMIADYGRCKAYAPHVLSVEERFRKSIHTVRLSIDLAELFGHCGFYLYEAGLYGSACTLLTTAKDILAEAVGDTPNPVSGLVFNNLSIVHSILTNFDQAFQFSEKALWHRTRCLPEGHPDIATTTANHADNLFDCGKHEDAVKYFSVALQIRESTPELASMLEQTLSNFGRNYTAMGDLENAERLLQRAMDMHPKMGRVTLYMAQTYWHVGNLKLAQGKFDEGFHLHKQSLDSRTAVLGEKHFLTGLSLHKYATLMHRRGQRRGAVRLFENAIAIFESTAQIEKGLLPRSLVSLADLLADMERCGEYYRDEDGRSALQMAREYRRRADELCASIPPFNLPPSKGEPQDAWVQLDCR